MSILNSARDIVNRSSANQLDRLAYSLDRSTPNTAIIIGAPIAGQILDTATTYIALSHKNGTFREANPIAAKLMVNSMLPFAAIKLGVGALMAYSVKKQLDKGNKKTAKILSGIGFLTGAGPAINNVVQMVRR